MEPTVPETGAKPVIRPPRRDELERLRAIERAAGRLFLAVGMPEIAADEPLPVPVLDGYRTRDWAWVVTVEPGDEPAGYVVVDVIDDPAPGARRAAHVAQVSVDPAHGRLGLGRRLLDHVTAVARQRRLDAVTLTTFRDVPWNARYFERCGFRALAEDELGAGLRRVRDAEAAYGLDPAVRVCMFRRLMQTSTPWN